MRRDDQAPSPLLPFSTGHPPAGEAVLQLYPPWETLPRKDVRQVHLPLEQFKRDSAQLKRRPTASFIFGHSQFRAIVFLQQTARICREKVNMTLLRLFVVYLARRREERGGRGGESKTIQILNL